MPPSPPERPAPTKKSLRIWVRNNGHMTRTQKRFTYVYPRTVEAAKDPFECSSGKNKMFFLIAINVFPDSKIIRPDTSDSETDVEETIQKDKDCVTATQTKMESQRPSHQQRRVLRRKCTRKYGMKKRLQPVTKSLKPHNPETQPNDSVGLIENVSQKIPSVAGSKRRPCSRKTGVKKMKVTNENETECSRVLQHDPSLSQTDIGTPNKINTSPKDNLRKKLPSILSSFHKVIQNCSDTGLVSFDISKKPRQSRS